MAPTTSGSQRGNSSRHAAYFGMVVILGVLVNLALAIPALWVPNYVLSIFGLDPGTQDVWVRFAAWLLILLSLFYVPAALNPFHSPINSWLTVSARFAGVVFFATAVPLLDLNPNALLLGLLDLVFAIPEGVLLALAFRHRGYEDEPS